ncbi:MAG: hypothetical protein ACUVXJ_19595 [Phycisphaerae bacterium]
MHTSCRIMNGFCGTVVLAVFLGWILAAQAQFTAYNDFVPDYVAGATNVTQNQNAGTYALKDYVTGGTVTPTMTITRSGLSTDGTGPSAEISGGDALAIFSGKVAGRGKVMAPSTGWYFTMEFSGLDVNKTYTVATFTDRGEPSYDNKRWANISLVNADSTIATYACSVGVGNYQVSPTSVSQDSGYNTVEGFVAMWTGIAPGPDGKFSVHFRAATAAEVPEAYRAGMKADSGYGPAGLMLEEEGPPNAINISPAVMNSVVGGATVSGTVSIPANSNADAPVQVTLISDNPAVADLVGASGGVLVLTFPQGGGTEQSIQIDIGQAGSATISSINDAELVDDALPVTVQTGAVTLAPTSLTGTSGAIRPVTVSISPGTNDTRSVRVTLTSDNPAVADLVGGSGGVLVLDFPQGGATQQTVNVQLGVLGEAAIASTNDGGLTDPAGVSVVVSRLRSWVLRIRELQGSGWHMVPTGGYDDGIHLGSYPLDGRYYWREYNANETWPRVYWRVERSDVAGGSPPDLDADIPSQPRLYTVEAWVPYLGEGDPRSWKQIDVYINGLDTPSGWNAAMVPWSQPVRTEWIARMPLPAGEFEGRWVQAGPGPHSPDGPGCDAGAAGPYLWLKRGSDLYMDFSWSGLKYGVSALRITEAFPVERTCDPPVSEGPVDLRCVGNSDPLYTIGEGFGRGYEANIDGNTLAVENYRWPCIAVGSEYDSNVLPLSPGLPYDETHPEYAIYTAQLPTGEVSFKLRYDGFNTMKWRTDAVGAFSKYNVFTLNEVPDREFISGRFSRLYVLATKGGGSSGKLRVEMVYSDGPSVVTEANLYDWFNQDGDGGSLAVGVDGRLRSESTDVIGFERLNSDGLAPGGWGPGSNGGDHGGAFLFVHPMNVDRSRVLTQIKIGLGDVESFGGELVVMGVTLEVGCGDPVFDVAGDSGLELVGDGDVDQQDFAFFQSCYTGTGGASGLFDRSRCGCLDGDGDGDIDGDDFARFEQCASGPGIPAEPQCDD